MFFNLLCTKMYFNHIKLTTHEMVRSTLLLKKSQMLSTLFTIKSVINLQSQNKNSGFFNVMVMVNSIPQEQSYSKGMSLRIHSFTHLSHQLCLACFNAKDKVVNITNTFSAF